MLTKEPGGLAIFVINVSCEAENPVWVTCWCWTFAFHFFGGGISYLVTISPAQQELGVVDFGEPIWSDIPYI